MRKTNRNIECVLKSSRHVRRLNQKQITVVLGNPNNTNRKTTRTEPHSSLPLETISKNQTTEEKTKPTKQTDKEKKKSRSTRNHEITVLQGNLSGEAGTNSMQKGQAERRVSKPKVHTLTCSGRRGRSGGAWRVRTSTKHVMPSVTAERPVEGAAEPRRPQTRHVTEEPTDRQQFTHGNIGHGGHWIDRHTHRQTH